MTTYLYFHNVKYFADVTIWGARQEKAFLINWLHRKFITKQFHKESDWLWGGSPATRRPYARYPVTSFETEKYDVLNKSKYYDYNEKNIYIDNYELFYKSGVSPRTYRTSALPRTYYGIHDECFLEKYERIFPRTYEKWTFGLPQLKNKTAFFLERGYRVPTFSKEMHSAFESDYIMISQKTSQHLFAEGKWSMVINNDNYVTLGQSFFLQKFNIRQLWMHSDITAYTNITREGSQFILSEHSYLSTLGDGGFGTTFLYLSVSSSNYINLSKHVELLTYLPLIKDTFWVLQFFY